MSAMLLSMSQSGMATKNISKKSHLGLHPSFRRQCQLAGSHLRQPRLHRNADAQPKAMMSDGPAYNKYR
jgi:hypothetical protein